MFGTDGGFNKRFWSRHKSAMNTAVLFAFLKRNPVINVASVVRGLLRYALKLAVFSLVAAVPAYFVRHAVQPLCAAHGRLLAFGVPLAASALAYGAAGILLRAAVARVRATKPCMH